MGTKNLREVMDGDALTSPISSEGGSGDDRECGDFAARLKAIEKKLAALELRFGDLPGTVAKTGEQFCQKLTGRPTASQLQESKRFCKKLTQRK